MPRSTESKGVLSRNIRRGKEEEEGYLSSAEGFFHGAARYPRITLPLLIAKYPESPRSSSN